jgi:hypothetical protein
MHRACQGSTTINRPGLHFSAEIPCYRGFFPVIRFFGTPPWGPFWRENGGIQAFPVKLPVELTGNFFARNREYDSAEQGIRFGGTGNTIPRNREFKMVSALQTA